RTAPSVRDIALDLGAMHQPTCVGIKAIAPVDGASIVPEHEVAGLPDLSPDQLGLRDVPPEQIEQRLAFVELKSLDIGMAAPRQVDRLAAGHRMRANDGMARAHDLARVIDLGESAAKLAGAVAAGIMAAAAAGNPRPQRAVEPLIRRVHV